MATTSSAKSRLRVAHIVLQLDTGGMEKLLVEFARHADRSLFDLRFVSLTGRGDIAQEIESCNWPVTALNEPPGLRPGMVLRLAQRFRDWGIDVVHTHNTKPLLYAGPAGRLAKVPAVVHTSHGQRYGSSLPHTMMFVMACRTVDRVGCVSQDIAALRAGEGIPQKKICTIWNGIDISRFAYSGPNASGAAVIVARLRPEKDIETLLRATALVAQRHPSFCLDIAGDGEREPALRKMVSDLKIERHVRFLGDVRDVPGLLGRASMFVLSSLAEGISISMLEAMARGLPVVATGVGGNPEVVLPGETGLLVPPKDPAKLADAIAQIWVDPEMGRRFGSAGRKRVEEHFDVKMMVRKYEALYDEIVCRRRDEPQRPLAGSIA